MMKFQPFDPVLFVQFVVVFVVGASSGYQRWPVWAGFAFGLLYAFILAAFRRDHK